MSCRIFHSSLKFTHKENKAALVNIFYFEGSFLCLKYPKSLGNTSYISIILYNKFSFCSLIILLLNHMDFFPFRMSSIYNKYYHIEIIGTNFFFFFFISFTESLLKLGTLPCLGDILNNITRSV